MRAWGERCPGWQVEVSFERSLPEIRKLLAHAHTVFVDGTEDPSMAVDAFLQAVARLGEQRRYGVHRHDARRIGVVCPGRGSLLLFGPMCNDEWDAMFDRKLRRLRPNDAGQHGTRRAA